MNKLNSFLKLRHLPLMLFSLFPLTPNKMKGFWVILFFISSIYNYVKNKKIKYPLLKVLFFSSIYIILLISLLYTDNLEGIDKLLSTRFGLLIIPVSFGFFYCSQKKISFVFILNFVKTLLVISSLYSIYILSYLNILGVFKGRMSLSDAMSYISNEMPFINQHPIYCSIFISISILLTFWLWFISNNKKLIIYTFPLVVIQFLTLLLLARKGVSLALIISLMSLIFFFIKNKINLYIKSGVILLILGFSVFLFSSNRFKELYKKENYSVNTKFNSTSLRFGIYSCTIEKIKGSLLVGYGLGDVQNELNSCYNEKSNTLKNAKYNSHNQYFSYFLSSGVFGFLLLFFFMFKTLLDAQKKKNILLLSITIFFAINMLFENILERQSGVILFSFYICLFSFYNFSKIEKK